MKRFIRLIISVGYLLNTSMSCIFVWLIMHSMLDFIQQGTDANSMSAVMLPASLLLSFVALVQCIFNWHASVQSLSETQLGKFTLIGTTALVISNLAFIIAAVFVATALFRFDFSWMSFTRMHLQLLCQFWVSIGIGSVGCTFSTIAFQNQ